MMYESILLFGVIFFAAYLFDTLTQSRHGLMLRNTRQAVLFLALGIYFVLCWSIKGQTLPMKTWNIRLLDKNGHHPRIGLCVLRYLLIWPIPLSGVLLVHLLARQTTYGSTDLLVVFTPFLIFLWSWLDPEQQFLHDRILGTRLVDTHITPKKTGNQSL